MTKYTDKIEQFLDDEMTAKQEAAFKAQVKTDRDLAREVEVHLLATDGIRYFQAEAIESEVVTEKPEVQQAKRPGILRRIRPIIGLAAAALIALLIWQPWQSSLYEHYVLDITEMGDTQASIQQAQDTYNAKDYAAAIPLLEQFPDQIPDQIAKANAHYNLGDYDAATATLEPIASDNSGHKSTANWYLALTYLKQDELEKAKAALRQIKSGKYYEDAQKMFKKIK